MFGKRFSLNCLLSWITWSLNVRGLPWSAIRSVAIVQWERVHTRRSCHNNHDDSSISAVLGQSSKDGWMPLIHIFQMSRFRKAFIDSPFDAANAEIISLSVCLQECSSFPCRWVVRLFTWRITWTNSLFTLLFLRAATITGIIGYSLIRTASISGNKLSRRGIEEAGLNQTQNNLTQITRAKLSGTILRMSSSPCGNTTPFQRMTTDAALFRNASRVSHSLAVSHDQVVSCAGDLPA